MARGPFTPEELKILRANPYTLRAEPGTVKFTYAFKVAFWEKYQTNPHPAAILEELGYNSEMLGESRINGISQKIRNEARSRYGLRDTASNRTVDQLTPEERAVLTPEQIMNRMQDEIIHAAGTGVSKKNLQTSRIGQVSQMILEEPAIKFNTIHTILQDDENLVDINTLCAIAGVSRSGYYRWVKAAETRELHEQKDRADFELILAAYQHRGYDKGARGIYMQLLHQNLPVVMNIKKIRRLMKKYGLHCPVRKANPYRRMAKAIRTSHVAEYLVDRKFTEFGPRTILLTDITYIPYYDGKERVFAYLSTIIDAYTRQVLSYVVSDSLEVDFVLETVEQLVRNHGVSLHTETIINSDQGAHYTSNSFIQIIRDHELRQSMSHRGNCWDNAPQESFFGHMKDEIDTTSFTCYEDVKTAVDDWMDYYNNERYQWQLAKLSPHEYYDYYITGRYPLCIPAPNGSKEKTTLKTTKEEPINN